jgi:hypothetical protein
MRLNIASLPLYSLESMEFEIITFPPIAIAIFINDCLTILPAIHSILYFKYANF